MILAVCCRRWIRGRGRKESLTGTGGRAVLIGQVEGVFLFVEVHGGDLGDAFRDGDGLIDGWGA